MTGRKKNTAEQTFAGLTGLAKELAERGVSLRRQIQLAEAGQDLRLLLEDIEVSGEAPDANETEVEIDEAILALPSKVRQRRLSGAVRRLDFDALAAAFGALGEDEMIREVAAGGCGPARLERASKQATVAFPKLATALEKAARLKRVDKGKGRR